MRETEVKELLCARKTSGIGEGNPRTYEEDNLAAFHKIAEVAKLCTRRGLDHLSRSMNEARASKGRVAGGCYQPQAPLRAVHESFRSHGFRPSNVPDVPEV